MKTIAVVTVLLLIQLLSLPASAAVILQYHHIADDTPAITTTSVAAFKQHMDYLEAKGYQVVPLQVIVDSLKLGKPLPRKTVSITFDDAYLDIYEHALPILVEKGFPFTLFVATEPIDNRHRHFLSWEQLKLMQQQGATITNHSRSHSHLLRRLGSESKRHWEYRMRDEIQDTQQALEQKLGPSPRYFAFPYGEYDIDLLNILEELDYVGFGQQSGAVGINSNLLYLPRFPLSGRFSDFDSFKTKLQTRALPIKDYTRDPITKGRPRLVLKFDSENYDFSRLACYGPEGKMQPKQTGPNKFLVMAENPVPVGRSRFNCTMPVGEGNPNEFYWYSQLWIRKNDNGSWYKE